MNSAIEIEVTDSTTHTQRKYYSDTKRLFTIIRWSSSGFGNLVPLHRPSEQRCNDKYLAII